MVWAINILTKHRDNQLSLFSILQNWAHRWITIPCVTVFTQVRYMSTTSKRFLGMQGSPQCSLISLQTFLSPAWPCMTHPSSDLLPQRQQQTFCALPQYFLSIPSGSFRLLSHHSTPFQAPLQHCFLRWCLISIQCTTATTVAVLLQNVTIFKASSTGYRNIP